MKCDLYAKRPLISAGPCSAETQEQTLETCKALAATGRVDILRAGVWKPRTKPGGFEGMGLLALPWMAEARHLTGLPIAVEVANAKHAQSALEFGVDMLWIGARTTVNPFSVQEIADAVKDSGISVLIKNPMNPDIELWSGAVARFRNAGIDDRHLGLIHRGFSYFGHTQYRNTPMWHVVLEMRSRFPELAMICDPSHICGRRDNLLEVAQRAADMSFNGVMIESHVSPDTALSDASQQVLPEDFDRIISAIRWRNESTNNPEFFESLNKHRDSIDQIDSELFELLSRRMNIAEKIGRIKHDNDVAILQGERWSSIVEKSLALASKLCLSEDFMRTILEAIHIESINRQNEVMNRQ
jgi:chorismate mutase